jgi:hypothetical protein
VPPAGVLAASRGAADDALRAGVEAAATRGAADAAGRGAATSRPASPRDSVIISASGLVAGGAAVRGRDAGAATTAGVLAVVGGGGVSGGKASRLGISIGMSTGIGRGWVSKTSGKPMMPIASRTVAPIRRCRARVRACWTASVGAVAAVVSLFCLNTWGLLGATGSVPPGASRCDGCPGAADPERALHPRCRRSRRR